LEASDEVPDFGMGTTLATFHSAGTQHDVIERLSRVHSDGAILEASCFSILGEISSGPGDLEHLSASSISITEHRSSMGQGVEGTVMSDGTRGSTVALKHWLKKLLSKLALS
jgi:hypothetical protein